MQVISYKWNGVCHSQRSSRLRQYNYPDVEVPLTYKIHMSSCGTTTTYDLRCCGGPTWAHMNTWGGPTWADINKSHLMTERATCVIRLIHMSSCGTTITYELMCCGGPTWAHANGSRMMTVTRLIHTSVCAYLGPPQHTHIRLRTQETGDWDQNATDIPVGVAMIDRLHKNIDFFYKRAL